eukprot:5845918-Prymnesium_polylepis.1
MCIRDRACASCASSRCRRARCSRWRRRAPHRTAAPSLGCASSDRAAAAAAADRPVPAARGCVAPSPRESRVVTAGCARRVHTRHTAGWT